MTLTPENLVWAVRKIRRFSAWKGFPMEEDDVTSRAKALLRIVHNQPVKDIMADAMAKTFGADVAQQKIDWAAKGMTPDQNDVDWLLDLITETMDTFPPPIVMRRMYEAQLPPSTSLPVRATED